MKKKLFLKFFVLAVIGAFVTFTSCKDYDDDISKLNSDLAALKADFVSKSELNALKTDLEGKITTLQAEVNTLKGDLSKYATKAELDAAKADILSKTVTLETFNNFKTWVEGEITKLKADVAKAATKDELQALETLLNSKIADLRTDLAAHIANFDALKLVVDGHSTAIADIQGELVEQLALINANKDEIAVVKADLQAKYDELTVEIAALKDRVTDLESGLAALDTKVEAYKAEVDAKIAALEAKLDKFIIDITKELNAIKKLIRSLVLIPHHYVNGVEAIGFNPLAYICGGDYGDDYSEAYNEMYGRYLSGGAEPVSTRATAGDILKANPNIVEVQYIVNPSTATVDMIDVDNLSFAYRYKENKLKSADIDAKAHFVSLIDGILTVKVTLDANEAEKGGWNAGIFGIDKMDMIALQVPLLNPDEEAVITSDWGRVDVEDLAYPMIDRVDNLCEEDGITYTNDYPTADDAKDMDNDDKPYFLELVYDKKHNLLDYVTSTVLSPSSCDEFNPADYGLVWNFDLLDEDDNVIVYKLTSNATDQQEFIKINDAKKGIIEARVYDATPGAGVTDAIGRTPIVRMQLIDPVTKCVVVEGFVKIKWVKDQPVFEVEYPKVDVDFTCDTETAGYTEMGLDIKTKWMNTNVMNAMGTYYTEFIHNYTLDTSGLYDANGVLLTGDKAWGTVVANEDATTGQPEVTDLFSVYLNNICDLTKNTTFTGYVHYTHNVTGQVAVVIKVTLNVNMPMLTVAGHNNTYWQGGNNSSNVFNVNPVQYKTDPQVNPTANYRTDLLNGFTNGTTYTDDISKIVKSSIKGYEPCNVEFVFDAEKLKSYTYKVEGVDHKVSLGNLQVSSDGKNLEFWNGTAWTTASYIKHYAAMPSIPQLPHGGEAIHLDESGDEAKDVGDSWPGKYAKALVGQKVPVKLAADLCCKTECDLSRDIRKFEVYFIPPMHINSSFTESFTDLITGGDYIKLDKAFTLTDFAGYLVSTATDNPSATNEKHRWTKSLWDYYEINDVVWNTAATKCNLAVVEGSNPPELDVVPGAKNALPINYIISYVNTAPNTNSLKFQNNSGAPLSKDFEIYVPVTVGHKWGTLSATVTIKVKKGVVQP